MTDVERKELENKGYFKGNMKRELLDDLYEIYPDCWIFITNCEEVEGVVIAGTVYEVMTPSMKCDRFIEFCDTHPGYYRMHTFFAGEGCWKL